VIARRFLVCDAGRLLWFRETGVFLVRSGGELLSHVLRRSTIAAAALNFRVRDGIGCFARAVATRPEKKHALCIPGDVPGMQGGSTSAGAGMHRAILGQCFWCCCWIVLIRLVVTGSNQAYRAISTGQLNALLRLHLRPIDVMVYHGSQGRPCFEGGFPLRCFQRLSCPFIATLHCGWRHNRSTSGTFTPVLSY
jgi:hypothetical protein